MTITLSYLGDYLANVYSPSELRAGTVPFLPTLVSPGTKQCSASIFQSAKNYTDVTFKRTNILIQDMG